MEFNITRGRLGRLHQILDQVLEPVGFALEHSNIVLRLRVRDVAFGKQAGVIDNGGQRGL